jgi:hypothetical protein
LCVSAITIKQFVASFVAIGPRHLVIPSVAHISFVSGVMLEASDTEEIGDEIK